MMSPCGRRNRHNKLLLGVVGVTLAAYLLFFRHEPAPASDEGRRQIPREQLVQQLLQEQLLLPDSEPLGRPVYEKPPLAANAPGELGRALHLNLQGDEKLQEEESIKKHQINIYVSDRVSLHRRLPERWNPL